MFELVITDTASGITRRVPLSGEVLTFGSAVDCDLVLPSSDISPRHCRLEPSDDGYRIVDLHSEHGTRVNDVEVGRVGLRAGDVVTLGHYVLAFLGEARSSADPRSPPAGPPRAGATPRPAWPGNAVQPPPASPVPRAVVRRRSRSGASTGFGALLLLGGVVLAFLFLRDQWLGDSQASERSTLESALAQAQQALDQCNFRHASDLLAELTDSELPPSARAERDAFAQRLAEREERYRVGDAALRELSALSDPAEFERGALAAERISRQYSDIGPLVDRAFALAIELRAKIPDPNARYQGLLAGLKSLDEVLVDVGQKVEEERYYQALTLLDAASTRKDTDPDRIQEARGYVEHAAQRAGQQRLDSVNELMAEGRLVIAMNYLVDEEVDAFRGTAIWHEFMAKADEIEELIDASVPAEARPFERRKHSRGGPAAGREAVASAPREVPRHLLIGQARSALGQGHFQEAVELVDGIRERTTEAELTAKLAVLRERAVRPQRLLELFVRTMQVKPLINLRLELRSGEQIPLVRSDGVMLFGQIDGREVPLSLLEVAPESFLKATARLRLDPESELDRAFLALACKDDKTFFACLEKVSEDSSLKAAVDVAVAVHRGLDVVPAGGFARHLGQWVTEAEREELTRDQAIVDAIGMLAEAEGDRRDQALTTLRLYAVKNPDVARRLLLGRRGEIERRYEDVREQGKLADVYEKVGALHQAREYALELIFDEEKYFYPYRPPECPPDRARLYPAVQNEVEARVQKVRDLWGDEFRPDDVPGGCLLAESTLSMVQELRVVDELLGPLGSVPEAAQDPLRLLKLVPLSTRKVTIRNLARDVAERARLDEDEAAWAFNQAVTGPTDEDLRQVTITNQYRVMMGRSVLRFQPQIHEAAVWHSDWMSRHGELTHYEDDPEYHSPIDRMRKFGYKQGAGENCCWGRSGASQAHEGWFRSSGHHRNMLLETHTDMASAQKGAYWSQKFGGRKSYDGNLRQ